MVILNIIVLIQIKSIISDIVANHNVSHISIEDFYINNNKVTDLSLIGNNEFVYKITLK